MKYLSIRMIFSLPCRQLASRSILMLLLTLLMYKIDHGQNVAYTPLRSVGSLPEDFIAPVHEITSGKNEADKNTATKTNASEFLIYRKFGNGEVLYGDAVSAYLSRLVDLLLKNNTELRSKIRIYAYKSPDGMMLSTPGGIILVPLELIAQCENEAQLAYLIAVEIARIQSHLYNDFTSVMVKLTFSNNTKEENVESGNQKKLLEPFPYSKTLEADSLGYKLFIQAGYNPQAALYSLDVLEWIHLPMRDGTFTTEIFQYNDLTFPDYQDDKTPKTDPPVNPYMEYLRLEERRELINKLATNNPDQPGTIYQLEKKEFTNVHQQCQYETMLLHLIGSRFLRVFYDAYCMRDEDQNKAVASEIMCMALYGMCKYKLSDKESASDWDPQESYGNFQQCVWFFHKLSKEQLSAITLRYLFDESEKNHNPFITKLLEDLIAESNQKVNFDMETVISLIRKSASDKASTDTEVAETRLLDEEPKEESKFDRLRKEKMIIPSDSIGKENTSVLSGTYYQTTLFKNVNLERLKFYNQNALKIVKSNNTRRMQYDAMDTRQRASNDEFGLDSLIHVHPVCYEIDKNNYLNTHSSIPLSKDIEQTAIVCSESAGMEVSSVSGIFSAETTADEFNQSVLLKVVTDEILHRHNDDITMISLASYGRSEELARVGKYHCCRTTAVNLSRKRQANSYSIALGLIPIYIVAPFLSPISMSILLSKAHVTIIETSVLDIRNFELVYAHQDKLKYKMTKGILHSFIFDNMIRIKSPNNTH